MNQKIITSTSIVPGTISPPANPLEELTLAKQKELELIQQKVRLQYGLPHIYGWKFYKWAKAYWDSHNKITLISAANQISKSSTQIRKHIHWATAIQEWPKLWPTQPRQFWYLYPTRDVAHIEFKKKWEPEFMPREEFKDDKQYGWKQELYHNRIFAIHWNSGVSTYFKTYAQDVQDLQTGTVHRIDLDEETPEELMSELFMRLAATDGHMSGVFTPTIGQDYWAAAFEFGSPEERFKDAFKQQVSMYDCLTYADGTPSHWTVEKIERAKAACKTEADIQRRIYGKFVVSEGLKYPSFHPVKNRKPFHYLPKNWLYFAGVDIGGGGEAHASAIVILGVSPDYKQGRVVDGWMGSGEITTVSDVVRRYIELTKPYPYVRLFYDWASKDFHTIATDMGLNPEPAEKNHAIGEALLNTLFKNNMLMIYDSPQLNPLVFQLKNLKNSTPKGKAKDDFPDALRYACAKVPWNWDGLILNAPEAGPPKIITRQEQLDKDRRDFALGLAERGGLITADTEIEAWNSLFGYGREDEQADNP
jgi:phage terminase large subunit-like protein